MSNLTLLSPMGLLALAAVPLIVLYHMRKHQTSARRIPTTRFWAAAEPRVTDHPRFQLPPLTLPFVLQLLTAIAIAFALARPAVSEAFGGVGTRATAQHQIMLLDGSTSMNALAANGQTRYEQSRSAVLQRLENLQSGDVGTVMIMGANPQTFQATDDAGVKSIKQLIADTPAPGGESDLSGTLTLAAALLMPELADQITLFTDEAIGIDPAVISSINAPIILDPSNESGGNNLAIIRFTTHSNANQPGTLSVAAEIANFSDVQSTFDAVISVDGIEFERIPMSIAAGETSMVERDSLPLEIERITLTLSLNDAMPVDNVASLQMATKADQGLLVQLISDSPVTLQRALGALDGVRVVSASTSEFLQRLAPIENYDLVIYDGIVPPAGTAADLPTLYLNPPLESWGSAEGMMVAPQATRLLAGDPLINDVDFAGVTFGDTVVHRLEAGSSEVAGSEKGPLIYRIEASELTPATIVYTFNLAGSNLPDRVAFPILIANTITELAPAPLPPAVASGEVVTIKTRPGTSLVQVQLPDATISSLQVPDIGTAIDGASLAFTDTGQAGDYTVTELDAKGSITNFSLFVVNAGHPVESNLSPNPQLPVALSASGVDQTSGSSSQLTDLWPAIALVALSLVTLEWMVVNLKRARQKRQPAAT